RLPTAPCGRSFGAASPNLFPPADWPVHPATPGPRRHASTAELSVPAFACQCGVLEYEKGANTAYGPWHVRALSRCRSAEMASHALRRNSMEKLVVPVRHEWLAREGAYGKITIEPF